MNILIIGGNQGIGLGLSKLLLKKGQAKVITTSRNFPENITNDGQLYQVNCDISSEASIDQLVRQLQLKFKHLDWVINCAGVLHTDQYSPEKSLSQVNPKQMSESFQTNVIGHLLLLQKIERLIAAADKPIVTSVSARIGSIGDNQLGGWYAYRMSKAALNMAFKTLEIEWRRKYPQIKLLLIHPGTTDTDLSKPFQKRLGKTQLQTVEFTAECIVKRIEEKISGKLKPLYVDFNGLEIAW